MNTLIAQHPKVRPAVLTGRRQASLCGCSSVVERFCDTEEAAGSIPASHTMPGPGRM